MSQVFNIEVVTSKTSLPILKVNDYYLHSKYDPKKEAEQFANHQYTENHVHVLFGYGYGYFAKALKNKCKEGDHFLIIDPLFNEIEGLITYEEFDVISDINEKIIEMTLDSLLNDYNVKVKVICSPNYDKLFPQQYKTVLKTVKELISDNLVASNTVNYFAEIWQENYIQNLYHIYEDESLSSLEKRYNLPVVIAAGGPSLTKQIPLLKKMQNHVIIIAAGSTVNTLLHYGIEADFIVSIDGSIANYKHFEENFFENSYLIYSTRNHYGIRNQFKKCAFSFIPSFETSVYHHIEQITLKQLPSLLGGASVANYALVIGQYISTGPVALIGQDLAYTNNQTHAMYNKRFTNIDDTFKEDRGTFYTDGYNGEEVLTDAVFLSMKKGFEQIADYFGSEVSFFNCTEGGAKIKGFVQIPFNNFYESIDRLEEKNLQLDLKKDIKAANEWQEFYHKIQKEINNYREIERQLNKGLIIINESYVKQAFIEKNLKGLDRVDKNVKKLIKKVSMSTILEPIIMDIVNNYLPIYGETEQEKYIRIYKQNSSLYNGLLNATKLSKIYTKNLLEKVEKEKLGGK
ncbi:motility associated factor glycosyltransferase family protein [Viridibacillus arvi]|uniref:motility associated factor glycosyltransferase family protein n=1 Tax=Viridibacillus arvi TaxID=263475 RepID=UPI00380FE661